MILITGCWDSKDINKKCIAVSIGVDIVNDLIEFSGEIVKLSTTKETEETSVNSGVYTILSYGKTFEEARSNYDSNNPFSTFLGATRVVVFGENYAKSGIEPYINRIDSEYDYRKTLFPIVSRESPRYIFELKTDKDISIGFLLDDILVHLKDKGMSICPNVGDILSTIAFGTEGYLLPYVGVESNDIKYLGLCVMKDSKFIDVISIEDTKPILYLLAKNPKLREVITNPIDSNNKYNFRIKIGNRDITTHYKNDNVIIDINLELEAELSYQYYIKKLDDKMIHALENEISIKIKDSILNIIKKAQKDYTCDIFSFGEIFKSQHVDQYNKINWEDAFLSAVINVNTTTKIINQNLKSAPKEEENNE
jgi:spore germination protein KC